SCRHPMPSSQLYLADRLSLLILFFFIDPPTTDIYTLSLHDALPICRDHDALGRTARVDQDIPAARDVAELRRGARLLRESLAGRSEEHTSELQSLAYLVCRLLLEKKKKSLSSRTDCISNYHRLRLST